MVKFKIQIQLEGIRFYLSLSLIESSSQRHSWLTSVVLTQIGLEEAYHLSLIFTF